MGVPDKVRIIGHFYQILKSLEDNRKLRQDLGNLESRLQTFVNAIRKDSGQIIWALQNDIYEIVDAKFKNVYNSIEGIKRYAAL